MKKFFYFFSSISILGLLFIFFYNKPVEKKINTSLETTEKKAEDTSIVVKDILPSSTKNISIPHNEKNLNSNLNNAEELESDFENEDELITNDNVVMKRKEDIVINKFRNSIPKIISQMKEIPNCLNSVENKKEAIACYEESMHMSKELFMALGTYEGDNNTRNSDFVWNDRVKEEMIADIKVKLPHMIEMKQCIDKANTAQALESCLAEK